MQALYSLPASVLLVLSIAVAVALACGGQLVLHRIVKDSSFLDDNDLTGYISGVIVTLFAVLIGFVTVVVWEQYNSTRDRVAAEAADAAAVWHDAVGLDPRARSAVRRDVLAYAHLMIDGEWHAMRAGRSSPQGAALIMDATTTVGTMNAESNAKSNAQAVSLQLLNGLHTEREQRLEASESPAVSGFMWSVMLFGAIIVVLFCYLFGASHRFAHLIMTGCVAAVIASMLVLSFELQFPFRGPLGISAGVWTDLLEHIRDMDTNGSAAMRM